MNMHISTCLTDNTSVYCSIDNPTMVCVHIEEPRVKEEWLRIPKATARRLYDQLGQALIEMEKPECEWVRHNFGFTTACHTLYRYTQLETGREKCPACTRPISKKDA